MSKDVYGVSSVGLIQTQRPVDLMGGDLQITNMTRQCLFPNITSMDWKESKRK